MKFHFDQSYAVLLIVLSAAVAAGFSFLLYRNKEQQALFSRTQIRVLAALRFSSVFLLAVLLLGPAIELFRQYKMKPVLVVAIDNSESMKDNLKSSEELIDKAMRAFPEFETTVWTFGEKARANDRIDASEVRSNYADLFRAVQEEYLGKPIGAMIVAGDGIFNSGTDPVWIAEGLPFPVYTVAMGDSSSRADAGIAKVTTNATAYLGDLFPVEINLSFRRIAGKTLSLTIFRDDEQVYRSLQPIPDNDFFKQELIRLPADKTGLQRYRLELESFDGEKNTANNRFEFTIRVIDQKQRILLAAHGAHPDLGALMKALEPQKNCQVELMTDFKKTVNPTDYDLIILHQLPDNIPANSPPVAQIVASHRPVLWIVGTQTSLPLLNNLQLGFSILNNQGFEFAFAVPDKNFNLFENDDKLSDALKSWPPLQVPFADVQLKGDWQPLFMQRIRQVDAGRPLVFLGRPQAAKYGVIMGEGLWQWRTLNYVQNGSFETFDNLVLKMVNYLILKPNEDNFSVFYQTHYSEDQDIPFKAELLNDSFEPVTVPEVTIELTSEQGKVYEYVFDKRADHYELNAGQLPAGDYSFEATAPLGEKTFVEQGSFHVEKVQVEQLNTQANFSLLYRMAKGSGGEFSVAAGFDDLADRVNRNRANVEPMKRLVLRDFASLKWFFAMLFALLAVEWFLRKYWGSY